MVREVYDDETVNHFESNYAEFLSTFSPFCPAYCIGGFAGEEVEARYMNVRLSRSPVAKIPALGYYLRKDLAALSEDDIAQVQQWIEYILAASYVGSAVYIFDGPVAQQVIRPPDELMELWGAAAYQSSPNDLGFADEPFFFKLVASEADRFLEFLKSAGVSKAKKGKLTKIIALYMMAGHILRRIDTCQPEDIPLPLMLFISERNRLAGNSEIERP